MFLPTRCAGDEPVEINGGTMAPGDWAALDDADERVAELLAAGVLVNYPDIVGPGQPEAGLAAADEARRLNDPEAGAET